MMIYRLNSKFLTFSNIAKINYCKPVFSHQPSFFYSGSNSMQKNSTGISLPTDIYNLKCFSKFTSITTTGAHLLWKCLNGSQLALKNFNVFLPVYSKNLLFFGCSKCQNTYFHSFWVAQCFVLLFIYYFASSKVFASSNSGIIQLHNENSAIEGENSENVQNQNSEALPDESTEGNQNHASNIDDPSLTHESVHQDNAVPTNELPTNSRENDDSSESAPAVAETDEPNIFAPVIIDELEVSSPVELNDARSLTHHHMVMQSAAVAAESSLLLLLRVSRALLAIMENYKSELEEMVQLLQYKAALLRNSGGAAQHSHALQQVTDALVVARAKEQSWEQQYKDGCLLMRVAHHSSDSAQLCAHIAGAEQDAMAVAAAVTALRPKIEQLQQEIRSLRSDVRTQHVEVIRSEQEGRRETRSPANAALD